MAPDKKINELEEKLIVLGSNLIVIGDPQSGQLFGASVENLSKYLHVDLSDYYTKPQIDALLPKKHPIKISSTSFQQIIFTPEVDISGTNPWQHTLFLGKDPLEPGYDFFISGKSYRVTNTISKNVTAGMRLYGWFDETPVDGTDITQAVFIPGIEKSYRFKQDAQFVLNQQFDGKNYTLELEGRNVINNIYGLSEGDTAKRTFIFTTGFEKFFHNGLKDYELSEIQAGDILTFQFTYSNNTLVWQLV